MALPALAIFLVFGVVPLVGVLLLSFTQWDGLGAIHAGRLLQLAFGAQRSRRCRTRCS